MFNTWIIQGSILKVLTVQALLTRQRKGRYSGPEAWVQLAHWYGANLGVTEGGNWYYIILCYNYVFNDIIIIIY